MQDEWVNDSTECTSCSCEAGGMTSSFAKVMPDYGDGRREEESRSNSAENTEAHDELPQFYLSLVFKYLNQRREGSAGEEKGPLSSCPRFVEHLWNNQPARCQ